MLVLTNSTPVNRGKQNTLPVTTGKQEEVDENKASTSELVPQFIVYNVADNCNYNENAVTEWSGFRITLSSTQLWQMSRQKTTIKKFDKKQNNKASAPFVPLGAVPLTRRGLLSRQRNNALIQRPYFSNPLFEKLPTWQFFNHPKTNKIINPSDAQRFLNKTPLIIQIEEWKEQNALIPSLKMSLIDKDEDEQYDSLSSLSPTNEFSSADDEEVESGILTRYSSASTILLNLTDKFENEIESMTTTTTKLSVYKIDGKDEEEDSALVQSCLDDSSSSSSNFTNKKLTDRRNIRRLSRSTRNATSHALKLKYIQGRFHYKVTK